MSQEFHAAFFYDKIEQIMSTSDQLPAIKKGIKNSRVADPHWFNADPDTAFFLIEDPEWKKFKAR
jgi:hypothetical protein